MKRFTKIQIATIILILAYGIWEFFVKRWEATLPDSDPVIRADLLIIYPILIVLIAVSLYQFFRDRRKRTL